MTYRAGDMAGVYRITALIGSGGAGEVYKAEHTITGRTEAIKVLAAGQPGAREQGERFLREIRIQASLNHPNIASVYNAFWDGDALVMAMELVEGESLKRILDRGRLPLAAALEYSCQALSALGYAHKRQVTHRDITPGNILITARGGVKLTDFGLAKAPASLQLTQTGAVMGSLYYISPEQIRSSPDLDLRADIYSMGAVLYEMVTGAKPFDGENAFAIMSAHVGQPPRSPLEIEPALPPGLSEIILKALAKEPSGRFQSAQEFRLAVESVRETTPRKAAGSRNGFRWATAAGIALVLSAGFLARPMKRAPAPAAPAPAIREPVVAAPVKTIAKVEAPPVQAPAKVEAAPKVEARPPALPNPRTIHANSAVWSVALSPSGRWLAAGTEDREIEIWDTRAGKRQAILRGHTAGVTALCFSHDDKWLASGGADRTAKLWDLRARTKSNEFRQGALVTAVALSADGRWLACASFDKKVKLWNLKADGKPEAFKEKGEPRALAFSPDSSLLAIGSPIGVKLWRVDDRQEADSLDRPAAALMFAANGHCLTLNRTLHGAKLWDTAQRRELHNFEFPGPVRSMAMSQNGRLMAVAAEGAAVSIWSEPE